MVEGPIGEGSLHNHVNNMNAHRTKNGSRSLWLQPAGPFVDRYGKEYPSP